MTTRYIPGTFIVYSASQPGSVEVPVEISLPAQPAGVTLVSISITPTSATLDLLPITTQHLTIVGTYSDASTADLTDTVMWNYANPSIAYVEWPGNAYPNDIGTTTFTAELDGVISNTVTINVRRLVSIDVTPAHGTPGTFFVTQPGTQQYTAMGTYSDASTADLTSVVYWIIGPDGAPVMPVPGLFDSTLGTPGAGFSIQAKYPTYSSIWSNTTWVTITP